MAVMPAPRETWTDERLDDLNKKVDDGFHEVRAEIRQFRTEVGARFDAVDGRFNAVESRFDAKFDAMQRLIIRVSAGLFGTMVIGFLGVIVAVITTQS